MSELPENSEKSAQTRPKRARPGQATRAISQLWLLLPVSMFALSVGAALARLAPAFPWASLPVVAAGVAAAVFALLLNRLVVHAAGAEPGHESLGEALRNLLDSAGPAVLAMDLECRLSYCNPAAERLLGYRAIELMNLWGKVGLLAPGEGDRLVAEVRKLCDLDLPPEPTPLARLGAVLACLRLSVQNSLT